MAEESDEPGEQQSAMDELFRMEAGLGCVLLAVAVLFIIAVCIYLSVWGLRLTS